MSLPNPVAVLAEAFHSAVLLDLPDVQDQVVDNDALRAQRLAPKNKGEGSQQTQPPLPLKDILRRPVASECSVVAFFLQTWPSTSLGFGGMSGQAFTKAYTAIIEGPTGTLAVYWSGRLAYLVEPSSFTAEQRERWTDHLGRQTTLSQREAVAGYGAWVARR